MSNQIKSIKLKDILLMLVLAVALTFSGAFSAMKVEAEEEEPVIVGSEEELNDAIKNGKSKILIGSDFSTRHAREISNTVTIDLNGHTIDTYHYFTIEDGGTLTVKDSSTNQSGRIKTTSSFIFYLINGELNIESGTYDNSDSYGENVHISTITNGYNTLNIHGGTLKSKGVTIYAEDGAIINIDGGTIESTENCALYLREGAKAEISKDAFLTAQDYTIDCSGEVNIIGGSINATSTRAIDIVKKGKVSVKGGIVKASGQTIHFWDTSDDNFESSISGGTFVSTVGSIIAFSNAPNKKFISGGYFSKSVAEDTRLSQCIMEGYDEHISKTDPIGYYIISKKLEANLSVAGNGTATITRYKVVSADENEIKEEKAEDSTSKLNAYCGETIKVEAKEDAGYEIEKISYTDKDGKETDITDKLEFDMPDSDVTVNVTFKLLPTPTPTSTPTPTPTLEPTPTPTSTPTAEPTSTVTPMVTSTPETAPTPEATSTPAKIEDVEKIIKEMKSEADIDGAEYNESKLKAVKVTKKSISYKWDKVEGATKYYIYGNKCNKKNKCKKLAEVTDTKFTLDNIAGTKLKKGTFYKLVVVATDDENNVLSTSRVVHVVTKGGKYTNHKSISIKKDKKIKKGKLTLKKGKTFKLKTKTIKDNKKLKVKEHRKVTYESDDTSVATVSKSGKIKAVAPGTCKIYAFTQNGKYTSVTVKVK